MEGEEEKSEDNRAFNKTSIPKRIAIVAAGAVVNIFFGLIVYFILMACSGTYITNEVDGVLDGYIAQEIGLQNGDKIVEIDNKKINNKMDLNKILENLDGREIELKIERNEEEFSYKVKPTKITENDISGYYLGVTLKQAEDNLSNRLAYAGMATSEFAFSIIDNLKQLFTGNVGIEQMTGPVGISEAVAKTNGIKEFVYLIALISLSLGVTNLLPIPALDGGKILILIIEAIRRKPLNEKLEMNLQLIGFSLLIILAIVVTYNDIIRIF